MLETSRQHPTKENPFNYRVLVNALCCIKAYANFWSEIISSVNNYFIGGSLCVLHFLTRDLCILTLTRILSNM